MEQKTEIQVTVVDGKPVANPDSVRVKPGTKLVWKAPADSAFEIDFTDGSPAESGELKIKSQSTADGQRITIKAKKTAAVTAFPYDISLDGVVVDPEVIIDP